MPSERQQFGVLYRDFLYRLIDVELLSAAGDVQKLLGQFAALLAAFSFTITVFTFPKLARARLPWGRYLAAVRLEQEFLIATTMAIAGLFSVLAWNAVFPDRRDSLVLGLLPVRIRTIFLAKVAAIGTALGVSVAAVNVFTGLCFPFLVGGLRSFAAHWITIVAAGLFIGCGLLALQGIAAQVLSYRAMLKVSSFLQLAAFFVILGVYFLKPSFSSHPGPLQWMPSFWFCGLLQVLSGHSDSTMPLLAARAAWGLAAVILCALATLGLAYQRNVRRIIEQPDITPADRSRPAGRAGALLARKLLTRPLDRAIILFTGRTLARSRQHRLLLAAYAGIGLAIALAYARDFLYGTSAAYDPMYRNQQWNRVNAPFLVGSLVLLFFAALGARAAFAMPIALPSNWIFRTTAVHSPAAYSSAVRKSLYALTIIPIWSAAAVIFLAIWPTRFAALHLAIMAVVGILIVEVALGRFRKVPFACSYLPGKAHVHTRLGTVGIGFLAAADVGVRIEYWALHKGTRFAVLFALLAWAAVAAWRRAAEFSRSPANLLQFEDLPPSDLNALDLHSDTVWREEAYVDRA